MGRQAAGCGAEVALDQAQLSVREHAPAGHHREHMPAETGTRKVMQEAPADQHLRQRRHGQGRAGMRGHLPVDAQGLLTWTGGEREHG